MDFNGVVYTVEGILSSKDPVALPTAIKVLPNYPNPFNPATNIKFELPQEAHVNLTILDILGRKVRTLINGEMITGGFHQIMWNGLSDSGAPAPSGVYVILFSADNYIKYYKALLIK